VVVGGSKDTTFVISNTGGEALTGLVSETCEHYSIPSGSGAFNITAGNSVTVTLRFTPTTLGLHACTIETGTAVCGTVACTGTGAAPPPGMVYVPADTLRMGQTGIPDAPESDLALGAFYISKYEVTTAQYQQFIAAGGYADSTLWDPQGWAWLEAHKAVGDTIRAPEGWKDLLSLDYMHNHPDSFPDFPVQGVSWFEADAYARYRGKRLPTEAEWEMAAKGGCRKIGDSELCDIGDRPDYPWGDGIDGTRANYLASGDPYEDPYGGTTPYGFYDGEVHSGFATQDSPSPYGAYDMSGNIREWCSSAYMPYPYDPADGRENPPAAYDQGWWVMRGGSYASINPADLRCAVRAQVQPATRGPGYGIRLALTATP